MKKLMIATAVAASMAAGMAEARVYSVSSGALAAEMWFSSAGGDVLKLSNGCKPTSTLSLGGFVYDNNNDFAVDGSRMTFNGQISFEGCLPFSSSTVRVSFDLSNGTYTVGGGNPGVTFSEGVIQVDVRTTSATGFAPYSTIQASASNVSFLANATPPAPLHGGEVTAGLVFPALDNPEAVNVVSLPGGSANGTADTAVGLMTILGNSVEVFLTGNMLLTPK